MKGNDISDSAKLHKDSIVTNSVLSDNCSVGDFSKIEGSSLEKSVKIDRNNYIYYSSLGKHSYTGRNTMILHSTFGAFCSISWNVSVGGANHDYSKMTQHSMLYDLSEETSPSNSKPVYDRYLKKVNIGNDVWIGAGAIILRGISIGDGAVMTSAPC